MINYFNFNIFLYIKNVKRYRHRFIHLNFFNQLTYIHHKLIRISPFKF